ncbi:MAG: FapA family protein [Kiritimatiellae bacterium]|nr:FapA family protein [Kiritimatiellia bacterium]
MARMTEELLQLPQELWSPARNEQGVIPAHVTIDQPLNRVRLSARGHIIAMQECYETELVSELGSVFVMYGATRHSTFSAGLNVYVKHAEEADITAGQDIVIEDSVRGSHLKAGRRIISESDKGRAIGGVLTAAERIELQALGSPAEISTEVNVLAPDGFIVCKQIYPGVSVSIGGLRRLFRKQGETGAFYRKICRQDKQLFTVVVLRQVEGDTVRYTPTGQPEVLLNH